jgi:hypothetical protein
MHAPSPEAIRSERGTIGDVASPARCVVCGADGDRAEMLYLYEEVPVHFIRCFQTWVEAEERQRVDWVVRLLRPRESLSSHRVSLGSMAFLPVLLFAVVSTALPVWLLRRRAKGRRAPGHSRSISAQRAR